MCKKLKKVYEAKLKMACTDMHELECILKKNSNIQTINVNPDNTIYLESNCGIDSIKDNIDEGLEELIEMERQCFLAYLFPLSHNSCIIKA